MEVLYELLNQNIRHLKILEPLIPSDVNSPLKKLFMIVESKERISDKECMLRIYGKQNNTAFSRLKYRLKEILLHGILFQINNNNPIDIRTNEALMASRYTLLGKSLITKDLNTISTEILEKSITRCIKYNITDDVLMHARLLINYYASPDKYNKYKYLKYIQIQEKYLRIYQWEVKSENYYLELQNFQYHSLANVSGDNKLKVKRYRDELESIKDINTFRFIYNKYRISTIYFEYNKDYNSILVLSDRILKEISKQPSISKAIISSISVRQLWAFVQAGRLDDTIAEGENFMSKVPDGSIAWYRLGYYVLKAHLYLKKYEKALVFLNLLTSHPKFVKLNDYFKELFSTPVGYMHLIDEAGLHKHSHYTQSLLPEFKLGKYLNETPVFSKDKRGINVSILLMHIAFLLQRKDYNAIIDRTDSLNQYAYRYLRRDDSFRSNCMIKMVIQMTKADFHPVRTDRYTAELRKQLSSVSLAGSGENIEIEVIPFEVLWDIMVKSL